MKIKQCKLCRLNDHRVTIININFDMILNEGGQSLWEKQ